MNPDPVAPVDLDSPFRFDHVLDFLTNVALCVAVVVGVTGAASSTGDCDHQKSTRNASRRLPGSCAGGYGHTFHGSAV